MKDIVIYGAGGFGMEVAFLIEDINRACPTWNLLGYLDDDPAKRGAVRYGYRVLGGREVFDTLGSGVTVVIAVAAPRFRKELAETVLLRDVPFPTLIHPGITISKAVEIGAGTIICAGCVLTVEIRIGNHVHINPACTIGHEVTVEDYVTLYPAAHVAGNVVLREGSSLGTGALVVQGLEIGACSFLGAGSVAIRDIPPGVVAAGCPAQIKKQIEDTPD